MYACASSPSVSKPSQPIDFHASSPSGPVTIMELFIGSSVLCWPGTPAVKPSVQRRIQGARTVPAGVRACPAEIEVTGVASYSRTPARGAEPGEARLEHDDPEPRVSPLEVIGGPQARVARPHDAHIGLGAARQRGPPGRDAARLPPVRHLPVAHVSLLAGRIPGQRARARSFLTPGKVASGYATWGAGCGVEHRALARGGRLPGGSAPAGFLAQGRAQARRPSGGR